MNGSQTPMRKTIMAFAVFAALFVISLLLFPFVAVAMHDFLPRELANHLFFWPQYLLVPNGLRGNGTFIGNGMFVFVAVVLWCSIGVLFGWLMRNMSALSKILAVYPTIILITVLVYIVLGLLGFGPSLEGF